MPALGPPPDPRIVPVPAGLMDEPLATGACLGIALVLLLVALWRRLPMGARLTAAVFGGTVGLTVPWLGHIGRHWLGAFPTIDKEGSLLFYLDGVHRRTLLDPVAAMHDPAVQLIGVHTGHLWLVELLDLLVSPLAAFGIWALLCPALGWLCAVALLRELELRPQLALAFGFPFGMGLHVFRDLNWYTIEKAMVFWLPLFVLAWVRARRRGGRWLALPALLWGVVAWMNLYFGLILALGAVHWTVFSLAQDHRAASSRHSLAAGLICAVVGLPVVVWQHTLMAGAPPLASPEAFLWQRAALDSVTLVPPAWNRLELWRALNPVALGAAVFGLSRLRQRPLRPLLGAVLVLALLSLGPALVPGAPGAPARVQNPVYMVAHAAIPGFWRMAKPEVFFELVWLALLALGATTAQAALPRRWDRFVLLAVGVAWLALVRTHPAWPGLSEPVTSTLAPDWSERSGR